jgi:hypothetical protein
MHHEVKTSVKGELVTALLPPYQGEKKVRAARIVALGIGPEPGTTRLALEGGAHVDVGKAWMQKHAPAGSGSHYYVQPSDGSPESILADLFESTFSLTDEPPQQPTEAPEATVTLDGEVIGVKEIEGAFEKIVGKLQAAEGQLHNVTLERDGARKRITQLEDELVEARAAKQIIVEGTVGDQTDHGAPTTADLDKDAEEKQIAEATGGATETQEGQS